jgi:transglutaminase-like putative cysteine protease
MVIRLLVFSLNHDRGTASTFASAMVLMLRTRGVPARLVNGFQMGEYNQTADVFTVRQVRCPFLGRGLFP